MFDTSNVKPGLSYHVTFQIQVVYSMKTIFRTVVDEGASTCVMSLIVGESLAPLRFPLLSPC
jgi:hypothetical protein